MPHLPIALQIPLGPYQKQTKWHPNKEHPVGVSFIFGDAPHVAQLLPAFVGLTVLEEKDGVRLEELVPLVVCLGLRVLVG